MKNKELYYKTINILVEAYFKNELQHSNCHACAVGNLVAKNTGVEIVKNASAGKMGWNNNTPTWYQIHTVMQGESKPTWYIHGNAPQSAYEQIKSTGYTKEQTAKIEVAFEAAPKGKDEDDWMFNGLMSVVDTLDKIHENTDPAVTTETKNKFNKLCLATTTQ